MPFVPGTFIPLSDVGQDLQTLIIAQPVNRKIPSIERKDRVYILPFCEIDERRVGHLRLPIVIAVKKCGYPGRRIIAKRSKFNNSF